MPEKQTGHSRQNSRRLTALSMRIGTSTAIVLTAFWQEDYVTAETHPVRKKQARGSVPPPTTGLTRILTLQRLDAAVRPQPNLTTKTLRLKDICSAEEDMPSNGLLLPPQGVVPHAGQPKARIPIQVTQSPQVPRRPRETEGFLDDADSS